MKPLTVKLLLIDDDEDDFFMLKSSLEEVPNSRFEIEWASSYESGEDKLFHNRYDVCFLDFRLGAHTGLDLLRDSLKANVKTPIILLTGYGEQEVDLEAMKLGAADYLIKDQVTPPLLERTIRYAIHRAQATQAVLDREAQILVQDRLASVGLLASSLAHEIGTPLGVIRGRAEYLEMQVKDDPNVKKNVEVIISQIDRVSKLIRSLLNLARGDKVRHAVTVDVAEILEEVLDLMAHELKRHNIQLTNEVASRGGVWVKAESGPLHQVLLNLLVNSIHAISSAIQAGPERSHSIRIEAIELDSQWSISIIDSGCGISESNMKNIFKPFFTTKDIGIGTGLGLATSYRIVEAWGGHITAESVENTGATFRILLPKADAPTLAT